MDFLHITDPTDLAGETDAGAVIAENKRRCQALCTVFDPLTGHGAPGQRIEWKVEGTQTVLPSLWLPRTMVEDKDWPEVSASVTQGYPPGRQFELLRLRHDFAYWAARYAHIKPKGGGADTLFVLNRPQCLLVERLEAMRTAGRPIRLILLKARQWGGSTCIQLYMAWLQLTQAEGLNSLIIAHQGAATDEIKDMFDRMVEAYPQQLLGETAKGKRRLTPVGRSRSAFRLEARACKIKVGTAERPDSCRGGDYNLVHLSEVGMWRKTLGRSPEDLVRSACSGVLYRPLTMIVYESTANGTGNFFHREYESAARGESQFEALFVSWHDIEQYSLPFANDGERLGFATRLVEMRGQEESASNRRQPGQYMWWLWTRGATLEALHWYEAERAKYSDHGQMASEYPSDDVEAFVHSGARVFDRYRVEAMRRSCRPPLWRGEVEGRVRWGTDALKDVHFTTDATGSLSVWAKPDPAPSKHRYLAVVDIGGRSAKADWSVVAVFDREPLVRGEGPVVVAQWRGHCDLDLLAWKAAQISTWYCNALLVIESNSAETRDRDRWVDGDQSGFILDQIRRCYRNLYARAGNPDDVRAGTPVRYGFHTNVNTKPLVVSALVRSVREGLYVERCEECLDELLTYERRPNGSYGAIAGRHDDMLMTRAIAMHISQQQMPLPRIDTNGQGCRPGGGTPDTVAWLG